MITYERLCQHPSAFLGLTGMSVSAFDRLFEAFAQAHARRLSNTLTKRDGQPRKRAQGCGPRHRHSLKDRLVMTLVWLRIYPTYEVLGFFFTLAKPNARFNVEEILETLAEMTEFPLERPSQDRKKLRSVSAVMDAFPEVTLVIDAKEQRIQRPSGHDDEGNSRQKPYYSGKKKAHTVKTQIGVRPDGFIEALSGSVPGATHDLTLLRQTGWIERLEPDDGAMMDKGYDGITNDHPSRLLYLPYKARRNRPLTDIEQLYNEELSSYRIVVEHTNAQLQKYQALAQQYRHDRLKHSRTIRVVAGLVNRQIEASPLVIYGAE
jgi:hypothetical protein